YSDDGKRKDVVQYYDGLNMSRQTVTGVTQTKNIFTQNAQTNYISKDNFGEVEIVATPQEIPNTEKRRSRKLRSLDLPAIGGQQSPPPLGCAFYGRDKIKEIIAQETIYDFNGRPAVQIMPVPTGTHKISYLKKLNK